MAQTRGQRRKNLASHALRAAALHASVTGPEGHLPSWAALSAVSSDFAHLRSPVLRAGMAQAIRQARGILRSNDRPAAAARAGFSVLDFGPAGQDYVKHVGALVSEVVGSDQPEFTEAVFLFGDNTPTRFIVRINHAGGMSFVQFTEPGRAASDADRAALAIIRTVVWPAVSAAFGLTALNQREFEGKLAQKM